ncbi:hypothetical protein [Tabrizicola sp.]|uniref:hypothetical protein n=1 Tax=Tabrizicola sp. TaxID=2005166 RepID=UPI0035B0EFA5
MDDVRTIGAVVFLILLAISFAGLVWSSRSADRLDGERRRRAATLRDDKIIGTPL